MATPANAKKITAVAKEKAVQRFRQIQRTAGLLKQVSDATRLQVILMLSEGEKHVGAMCEATSMTQPALSHHLALLRHGGIVTVQRRGKNSFYALDEMGEVLAKIVKGVVV
jgi:DNA-binding transcriptional ArsR family regulator